MSSQLRVAILGCGQIAAAHAQEIAKIPAARVVAACDSLSDLARQLAERFSIPETHSDLTTMLARAAPDVVPGRDRLITRVGNFVRGMGGRRHLPYPRVANSARGVVPAGEVSGIEGECFNLTGDELPTGRQRLRCSRVAVGRVRRVKVPLWAIAPLSRACERECRTSHGQFPAVLTRYKSQAMWEPLRYPNDRAKRGLGWRPENGLGQGLRETFGWMRENRHSAEGSG